jgi:mRNA-degrading endonuclease toxin of MazEF toxin-antitoxin module
MNYERGDVVIVSFPFVTTSGVQQKARPALVISDHSIPRRFDDIILVGITSKRVDDIAATEYLIKDGTPEFTASGLAKSSVVRGEYVMTVPRQLVARKLGHLPKTAMADLDKILKKSLGLTP